MRQVRWQPLALRDVAGAAAWYGLQGGPALEIAFADSLEAAVARIARNPGAGAGRYGELLRIEGLRHWPLRKFPYLVFYFNREPYLDVWRVLQSQRDVPAWMATPQESR